MLDPLDQIPPGAGVVGLLSSDEFTPAVAAFDRALLARASAQTVAVLPAADPANADVIERLAGAHLEPLGASVVADPERADVVYLPGGDPAVLLRTLKDDERWPRILDRWRAGATSLAGSSAGAMGLCEHCLVPGPGDDKPTRWTSGAGPLRNVGLAVHAATRPDEWLRHVAEISRFPVIALDDATGVVLAHGDEPVVIGLGTVSTL